MSGPVRLIHSKGLGGRLLASARGDRAPEASRRKALAAAAAVAATTTSVTTASAVGSTLLRWAVWKWVAVGVTGALAAAAGARLGAWEGQKAPSGMVAPRGMTRAGTTPKATVTSTPTPTATPTATATATATATTTPTATAATRRASMPKAASNATPTERRGTAGRLAAEIAAIDEAKKILASGDASSALRLLDEYETESAARALAPEAAALRIEALESSGRHDEACVRWHAFQVKYPESPLLERLERRENERTCASDTGVSY